MNRWSIILFLRLIILYAVFVSAVVAGEPIFVGIYLNQEAIDAHGYENSARFRKFNLKAVRAFEWRHGKLSGVIILAQQKGIDGDTTCLVYSATRRSIRYVASSQWRTNCRWTKEKAVGTLKNGRPVLEIPHEINHGEGPDGFFRQKLELFFDSRRRDFCSESFDLRIACPKGFY